MFCRSILSLALAAALPAIAADLPRFEGETTVVTAIRAPHQADRLASEVTTITAADIAKSAATDLPALLARQPGVAITQSGGAGQTSSLFMRGTNSNHSILLVDGQRVASATTGAAAWQLIPLELVDRIEIVRGGTSGAYGADAIGGVVQVFTKQGSGKPQATASVEYGSYGHAATHAGVRGTAGNLRYQFSARASDESGINATVRKNSNFEEDRDGHRNVGFSGNMGYFITENHEVGGQLLYSNSRTEFDAGGNPGFPVTQNRLLSYSVFSRNVWLPGWESTLRLGESRDWSKADGWDWNNFVAAVDRFETRQQQASWSNRFDTDFGGWVLGADWIEDAVQSSVKYDRPSRRTHAIFAGWSKTLGIHSMQVNLRRDHNSQFGGFTSGNAGYSVAVLDGVQIYGNIGKAFHAPTFNDLYYPASMWFAPNPKLLPEKARTLEVGVKTRMGDWQVNTAFFNTKVSDLITSTGSTMANVGDARIRGVTLAVTGKVGDLDFSGNVTWQDPRDLDKDRLLKRRARVLANARLAYRLGDWHVFSELEGQSERYEAQNNTQASRMHGYALTHVGVDYQFNKNWLVSLRLNNAFNQSHALVKDAFSPYADYATAGRTGLIKLSWSGDLR